MNPFYYVLAAGLFAGTFQIARKVISTQGLSPLVGATIFSLTAGLLGVIFLLKQKFVVSSISSKSLLIAVSAGLLVLPIDYFILKAYEKGYPIALGSVVLVGVSAGIAIIFGTLFLRESLSFFKAFAILLILLGVFILKFAK